MIALVLMLMSLLPAIVLTLPDCYEGNGSGYRGRKTTTISGRKCQDWGSQSPHKHKYTPERFPGADLQSNYCRNPQKPSDSDPEPWCYTTDRNKRFEYCGIPKCSEGMHVQCRLEDNVKYSDYNMFEDKVWNVQECQQNCIDQYPTCKGFTFKKKFGGVLPENPDGRKENG